jgi:hypothetical protein
MHCQDVATRGLGHANNGLAESGRDLELQACELCHDLKQDVFCTEWNEDYCLSVRSK